MLCHEASGRLCTNNELNLLKNIPIGCNFDNLESFSIEDDDDNNSNKEYFIPKYPKCCADIKVLQSTKESFCNKYNLENINKCNNYKTENECMFKSGFENNLKKYGNGNLLNILRNSIKRDENPNISFFNNNFQYRDNCVWCPNTNKCLPGGDKQICNKKNYKEFFAKLLGECEIEQYCNVKKII